MGFQWIIMMVMVMGGDVDGDNQRNVNYVRNLDGGRNCFGGSKM